MLAKVATALGMCGVVAVTAADVLVQVDDMLLNADQLVERRRPDGRRQLQLVGLDEYRWSRRSEDGKRVVVPVDLTDTLTEEEASAMRVAMNELEERTGVISFVEHAGEAAHIKVVSRGGGCTSLVGQQPGARATRVSLKSGADGCSLKHGYLVHVLMHALGWFHEETRSDRDEHVRIIAENVRAGQEYSLAITADQAEDALGVPYDFDSVMHSPVDHMSKGYMANCPSKQVCYDVHLRTADDFCIFGLPENAPEVSWQFCKGLGEDWTMEEVAPNTVIMRQEKDRSLCLTVDIPIGEKPAQYEVLHAESGRGVIPLTNVPCREAAPSSELLGELFTPFEGQRWQVYKGVDDTERYVVRWDGHPERYCLTTMADLLADPTQPARIVLAVCPDADNTDGNTEVAAGYTEVELECSSKIDSEPLPLGCVATSTMYPTIEALGGETFGQREGLSAGDVEQIWLMYRCPSMPVTRAHSCRAECPCAADEGRCQADDECEGSLNCGASGKCGPWPSGGCSTDGDCSGTAVCRGGKCEQRCWREIGKGKCAAAQGGKVRTVCKKGNDTLCAPMESCLAQCESEARCHGVEYWNRRGTKTGTCKLQLDAAAVAEEGKVRGKKCWSLATEHCG